VKRDWFGAGWPLVDFCSVPDGWAQGVACVDSLGRAAAPVLRGGK
jgi:hypothetical protein